MAETRRFKQASKLLEEELPLSLETYDLFFFVLRVPCQQSGGSGF